MTKRKAIPKKLRFEVLKKFSFKCQYCGRSAPEVLLEIDHIKPVAEGGTNKLINLTVACKECNIGKGKRLLDDKTVIDKSTKQMQELQERKDQISLMIEWQNELQDTKDESLDRLVERWYELLFPHIQKLNANERKEIHEKLAACVLGHEKLDPYPPLPI